MRLVAFWLLWGFSGLAFAENVLSWESTLLRGRLAFSHTWLALHYYVPEGTDAWNTEVRQDELRPNFFLDPEGTKNPERELLAFIRALLKDQPQDPDEALPCRFPARFLWVKQHLPALASRLPEPHCPRYAKWRAQVESDSAYLLFASQFMNSPASMYGHTLLELGRSGLTHEERLLDYVVAYGAQTGGASGISYLVLGLAGGFPGFFSTVPFYLKIQEYNDAESRDIWAYELNLRRDQVDFLIRHLWEARTVNFPYYFLGKNCSYFLLRLLEVVSEGKSLTEELPGWTIPVDTIRVLRRHGWIRALSRRPSRAARMLYRRSLLQTEEQELAQSLGQNNGPELQEKLKKFPAPRQAMILDTAYEYFRFLRLKSREQFQKQELWLLSERRKNPAPLAEIRLQEGAAPETSHLSNRVGVGMGIHAKRSYEILEWRPALHDLLSDPQALDRYGEQEILNTRWRIENSHTRLLLESLDLVRIRALSPLDPWIKKISWHFRLGSARAMDTDCVDWHCTFFRLEGGAGASLALAPEGESLMFLLGGLDIHTGAPFSPHYRLGIGPEFGMKIKIVNFWRMLGEAKWKYYFAGDKSTGRYYSLTQSFALSPRWEIRAQGEKKTSSQEGLLSIFFFY